MVLGLVVGSVVAFAPQKVNTYGKSESEILGMGGAKWVDYYTSKAGESTLDYNVGWNYFAEIASRKNSRDMAHLPQSQRLTLKRLTHLLDTFSADMVELGSANTGGGTIWNIAGYAGAGESEEVIGYALHPAQGKFPKHVVVSQVQKEIEKIADSLKKTPEHGGSAASPSEVKKELASARDSYGRIVEIASQLPRNVSDRILGFCLSQAEQVFEE